MPGHPDWPPRTPATYLRKPSNILANGTAFTSPDTSSCRSTFICSSPSQSEPNCPSHCKLLKQNEARRLRGPEGGPLWQPRYYDFNVWSYAKQIEKLRYIHRNPVRRGLVQSPEEWAWSSFRHYLTGAEGAVEIESHWTARKLERMGVSLTDLGSQNPRPVAENATRAGHPER